MAGVSLVLARMVPEHPAPGMEVIWQKGGCRSAFVRLTRSV
ncbi:hypothetical protein [Aliamphritea spongicola]|nr:hypothetical protein [Aliamphritea spongicola]